MKALILGLLCVLGLDLWSAYGFECGRMAVHSVIIDDGKKLSLFMSEEQFDPTLEWSPGQGEPPLSISKATKLALDWAKNKYSRFDSVGIWSIAMYRYSCFTSKEHWFYIFNFQPIIEGAKLFGGAHFAAVLMDGTVIGPEADD